MASTTALSVAMAIPSSDKLSPSSLFKPLLPRLSSKSHASSKGSAALKVQASMTEKLATGVTAGVLTAAMMVPDVAEAATGGSASLQNFLYSILAGGVVLAAIFGAVIGVSNFDPVKRI
uniref:Photosystem II subunit X n=1 Tax=Kalanchoe fedtschenkoi TaxID=63787 RepID=A0A7N0TVW7_KALFE